MTTTMELPLMEGSEEIQRTLREIDRRVPNALRAAFRLGYRCLSSSSTEDQADMDAFIAKVLPPAVSEDDGDHDHDHHRTVLDELPFARDDCFCNVPAECECKNVEVSRARALRMDWASCYVPASDHDAHFGVADPGVVGVADGVSGYAEKGVDAGAFSRSLMASACEQVTETAGRSRPIPICPYTLLERAYEGAASSGVPGASTAVILSLAGNALRWANVGDSGFAVLRGGTVVHRSRPQQTHFNCPFQLAAKGGQSITEAEVGEVPVRDGDVVVAGTDGLFDNMFDADLERVVRMGTALGFSPKNMADIIAGIAYEMSWNPDRDSPYSVGHRKHQAGSQRRGGKGDDITVVVAFIVADQLGDVVDKVEEDDAAYNSSWMNHVQRKKRMYKFKNTLRPSKSFETMDLGNRSNRLQRSNSGPISRARGCWF